MLIHILKCCACLLNISLRTIEILAISKSSKTKTKGIQKSDTRSSARISKKKKQQEQSPQPQLTSTKLEEKKNSSDPKKGKKNKKDSDSESKPKSQEKWYQSKLSVFSTEADRDDGEMDNPDDNSTATKIFKIDDDDDYNDFESNVDLDTYETESETTSSSEEETIIKSSKKHKRPSTPIKSKRIIKDVSESENGSSSDDLPIQKTPKSKRRQRRPSPITVLSDEGFEKEARSSVTSDDENSPPLTGRRLQRFRSVVSDSDSDSDKPTTNRTPRKARGGDIRAELNDLTDAMLTPTRMRNRPMASKYRIILEKARNKSRSQSMSNSQASNGDNDTPVLDEDIEDSASVSSFVVDNDLLNATNSGGDKNDPIAIEDDNDSNTNTDDDNDTIDDFVVSDEEVDEGMADPVAYLQNSADTRIRDPITELPEEFNLSFARDLSTSFQIYLQFLVHCLVNGGGVPKMDTSTSRYFESARDALEQRLQSTKDSIVGSSAWYAHFLKDLKTYPEISSYSIDSIPGCDACHFADKRTASLADASIWCTIRFQNFRALG